MFEKLGGEAVAKLERLVRNILLMTRLASIEHASTRASSSAAQGKYAEKKY
jgi:hypothetical protein